MIVKSISMDTSDIITDLCVISSKYRSDKCPYVKNPYPESNTVHPYTAIYDSLFSSIRDSEIDICEIGIAYNDSIHIWNEYFNNANIYGFDINKDYVLNAKKENIPNTDYGTMDVTDDSSIEKSFKKMNVKYDIILDDSTHHIDDQIRIIKKSINHLNSNGILIIEDVIRDQDEDYYLKKIKNNEIYPYFSEVTFIKTDHNKRKFGSPSDWPYFNDKLLILKRNNKNKTISYL